jgi:hypothetical protein
MLALLDGWSGRPRLNAARAPFMNIRAGICTCK